MKQFRIIFFLLISCQSFGQSSKGTIRGTIEDSRFRPISEARVKIYMKDSLISEAISDEKGKFKSIELRPGEYSFRITHKTIIYADYETDKVIISADRITFFDDIVLLEPGETPKKRKHKRR